MKKLLTGMLVICMVLGFGSLALAQTGEISADMLFGNHVLKSDVPIQVAASMTEDEVEAPVEAPVRLTTVKGEFSIMDKLGVVGSFTFGKSEKFEGWDNYAELSNMGVAVQYEIVPMIKARAGFFSGSYGLNDGVTKDEIKMSGITVGAAVDAEVADNIGVFGEAVYAPKVSAVDLYEAEFKDSSMMAFEAGGKYYFDQFAVKAGYRHQGFTFKAEDADAKLTATFSGFFVGACMNF